MKMTERLGGVAVLLLTLGAGCGEDEGKASSGASGSGATSSEAGAGGTSSEAGAGGTSSEAGSAGTDSAAGAGGTAGRPEASGGTAGRPEASGGAAGSPEASGGAAGSPEASGGAAGSAGTADDPGGSGNELHGFTIREPEERSITCSEAREGITEPSLLTDEDYLCTFVHDSVDGYVYVQATPTDCAVLMSPVPTTFTTSGWSSVDGEVRPLEGLAYDHGGNHFNNAFEFDYASLRYRFAHSSIGFGGRSCQPPDCLQVFEPDGTTLVEDGCASERTLPVTCVAVELEAVVPPLEDTFEPCPGDTSE